jgi:hypothetical protein
MREQNIGVTLKEAKIRSILYFLIIYEILILTFTLFANNLALHFDIKKACDTAWWCDTLQGPVQWHLKRQLPLFNAVLCTIEDSDPCLVQCIFPA